MASESNTEAADEAADEAVDGAAAAAAVVAVAVDMVAVVIVGLGLSTVGRDVGGGTSSEHASGSDSGMLRASAPVFLSVAAPAFHPKE